MLKKLVGFVWKFTPYFVRMHVIRLTQTKFTVSVAAVITNDEGKVLLLEHILRPKWSWAIPGGFIEQAEQPETAIKREIKEETDLELENLQMLRVRTINRHVEMLFRANANGEVKINPNEITDFGWFDFDELPENVSPVQKVLLEKVLKNEV
ncbi:MAG TPA: NUDIX hydrolase [Pyrinomonadaceae bacterium]|nr:NUDIX hydrolase [Pyrinomonadaceae bacterium]